MLRGEAVTTNQIMTWVRGINRAFDETNNHVSGDRCVIDRKNKNIFTKSVCFFSIQIFVIGLCLLLIPRIGYGQQTDSNQNYRNPASNSCVHQCRQNYFVNDNRCNQMKNLIRSNRCKQRAQREVNRCENHCG